MNRIKCDVAIIGGGPAGSTVGALLKKLEPTLNVRLFEAESFPRDHVGESQLPAITQILEEIGVWSKVEAAGFPIKLGGTYRWGRTDELWHLNFIPPEEFVPKPRPAQLDAQRRLTAFQVDRAIYDSILLDHAETLGCEVHRRTRIVETKVTEGYILKLVAQPSDSESFEVKARYYVDASGEVGVLRRALGVGINAPTGLRNIAFWDYWQQAEWAEKIGGDATRIQVMSLGWGWLWFIPISATRTSIGLVVPAEYFKRTGKRPEQIYMEAVVAEPKIAELVHGAQREHKFAATKDWNYIVDQLAGENWFLVGDSCGFADPILSAGMTLAHTSARKVAYSLRELFRKRYTPLWIREQYSEGHKAQIRHHMRFADFWYSANGRFTDLKAYCSEIASNAGIHLSPDEAFAWLGTGGFALDKPGFAHAATFPLSGVKHMTAHIIGVAASSPIENMNVVWQSLEGAVEVPFAIYEQGQIISAQSFVRDGRQLPFGGMYALLLKYMKDPIEIDKLLRICLGEGTENGAIRGPEDAHRLLEALEALVLDGWAKASFDDVLPPSSVSYLRTVQSR